MSENTKLKDLVISCDIANGLDSNAILVNSGNVLDTWCNTETYNVLGTEISIKENFINNFIGHMVASLNVLGKPYYDELKKQGISFPVEIEDFLKIEFKIIERNNKIDSVIK